MAEGFVDLQRSSTLRAESSSRLRARLRSLRIGSRGKISDGLRDELVGVVRDFHPVENPADESRDGTENVNDGDDPADVENGHGEAESSQWLRFDGDVALAKFAFQGFRNARVEDELPNHVEEGNKQEPRCFRRGGAVLRSAAGDGALQGEDVEDAEANGQGND